MEVAEDQTWKLAEGCILAIGSANEPVSLDGTVCISVHAAPGSSLRLHLTKLPQTRWALPTPLPDAQITVDGRPAKFTKQGEFYTISEN